MFDSVTLFSLFSNKFNVKYLLINQCESDTINVAWIHFRCKFFCNYRFHHVNCKWSSRRKHVLSMRLRQLWVIREKLLITEELWIISILSIVIQHRCCCTLLYIAHFEILELYINPLNTDTYSYNIHPRFILALRRVFVYRDWLQGEINLSVHPTLAKHEKFTEKIVAWREH